MVQPGKSIGRSAWPCTTISHAPMSDKVNFLALIRRVNTAHWPLHAAAEPLDVRQAKRPALLISHSVRRTCHFCRIRTQRICELSRFERRRHTPSISQLLVNHRQRKITEICVAYHRFHQSPNYRNHGQEASVQVSPTARSLYNVCRGRQFHSMC